MYYLYLYNVFEVICVRLSPEGSIIYVFGMLEEARIPHVLNSIFLLISW